MVQLRLLRAGGGAGSRQRALQTLDGRDRHIQLLLERVYLRRVHSSQVLALYRD